MVVDKFQAQGASVYERSFDDSEEGPFEVHLGHKYVGVIRKPVHGAPKLYVYRK